MNTVLILIDIVVSVAMLALGVLITIELRGKDVRFSLLGGIATSLWMIGTTAVVVSLISTLHAGVVRAGVAASVAQHLAASIFQIWAIKTLRISHQFAKQRQRDA